MITTGLHLWQDRLFICRMNINPSWRLVVLLISTACLCGSLFADQNFDFLRKAAEQGKATAQFALGNAYRSGEGVAEDSVEAVKWYRKAAEQGDARAQFNLGVDYRKGEGVAKDLVEAVKWYRKAAEQGHAAAQCSLGVASYKGEGVARNPVEGYAWINLAAVTDEDAAKMRANLEKVMTAQQVADSQRRTAALSALILANQAKK